MTDWPDAAFGRRLVYDLIGRAELRRRLVPAAAIRAYMAERSA